MCNLGNSSIEDLIESLDKELVFARKFLKDHDLLEEYMFELANSDVVEME